MCFFPGPCPFGKILWPPCHAAAGPVYWSQGWDELERGQSAPYSVPGLGKENGPRWLRGPRGRHTAEPVCLRLDDTVFAYGNQAQHVRSRRVVPSGFLFQKKTNPDGRRGLLLASVINLS